MNIPRYTVNLDLPPGERWDFLAAHRDAARALMDTYLHDLAGAQPLFDGLHQYKNDIIPAACLQEMDNIARITGLAPTEVLMANLYYDVLKFYFGCTAFACNNGPSVIHARNLDWHTTNNLLSKYTALFDFQRGGQTVFTTVGWPGFAGALSGIKPGAFAVTLNAVLSSDAPEVALPISFFIREVLEHAPDFDTARQELEQTTIASDCLLLLSGTQTDQIAVIERTPRRFATRGPVNGLAVVTNDYRLLENQVSGNSVLQATSCGRFDRAHELLTQHQPLDAGECLRILADKKVMMGITVQQMVFDHRNGLVEVIRTGE